MITAIFNTKNAVLIAGALMLAAPVLAATDTITLRNKKTYQGNFLAYKSGRFSFQPAQGKKLFEMKAKVTSLTLTPPSRVTVKEFGGKKRENVKLVGYEKSKFILDDGGKELLLSRVIEIKMGLDFRRTGVVSNVKVVSGDKEELSLKSLLKTGSITIIHFHHKTGKTSSHTRMENYVGTLADDKKKNIAVTKVEFTDWSSPAAVQYEVKSTPQFWFYSKTGKLAEKLVERFTDADIEAALKKAGKR